MHTTTSEQQHRRPPRPHPRRNNLIRRVHKCRDDLDDADKGYHEQLYEILAEVYQIAEGFRDDPDAWAEFTKEAFWGGCTKKPKATDDLDDVILWVTRFISRAAKTKGTRYNRAYKHARTLQGYAREGVAAEEVAARLAKLGVEYAFTLEAAEHPRQTNRQSESGKRKPRGSAADEDVHKDEDRLSPADLPGGDEPLEGDDTRREEDSDGEERPARRSEGKGPPPPTPKRMGSAGSTKSDVTEAVEPQDLSVEVTSEQLDDIIAAVKRGERPTITLERVKGPLKGKPHDWVRVRACKIEYR